MVMTSEGMLSLATKRPLRNPQAAPVAKAQRRPTGQGAPPWAVARQNAATPSAMIDGKERSISPVMTTKVNASAMMPNCGVVCAKAR